MAHVHGVVKKTYDIHPFISRVNEYKSEIVTRQFDRILVKLHLEYCAQFRQPIAGRIWVKSEEGC